MKIVIYRKKAAQFGSSFCFAVTALEEMKGITEILFTCVTIKVEHEVDGRANDDVFNTNGIGAWTLFQMKLSDTLLNAPTQIVGC